MRRYDWYDWALFILLFTLCVWQPMIMCAVFLLYAHFDRRG
jgi:hypothetical protein